MNYARIAIDPDVLLGNPVVRGTRIAVEMIVRKLSEGATERELIDAHPRLTRDDIRACLLFAADTLAHDVVVRERAV